MRAPTAHTPTPHNPYCLHSLLYIESSYRPPMRAQTPAAPTAPTPQPLLPPLTAVHTWKVGLHRARPLLKPPPPPPPPPCTPTASPPPPPPTPPPHDPYCLHSLLVLSGLQCVPTPPPPPPPPPRTAPTASTHCCTYMESSYRPPMRAQTPSAPTAPTAYTPTPHGPDCLHSLLYIYRKFPHPARPLLPPLTAVHRQFLLPPHSVTESSYRPPMRAQTPSAPPPPRPHPHRPHRPTPPHGPYCLHLESSYRPPMRAQTPSAPTARTAPTRKAATE